MRVSAALGVCLTLTALSAASLAAQDVELLGAMHGTRPPDAYYELMARDPTAFQFAHGRSVRMRQRMLRLAQQTISGGPSAVIGPEGGIVKGSFHVPVLLGLFSDSPTGDGPYSRDAISLAYFGDSPGTVSAYYKEVSGGMVNLVGNVQDWERAVVTQSDAAGGAAGLVPGTVGPFILSLLEQLPTDIDWGVFDNDGPDDIPNSGDDDGYVDFLVVLQPTYGAECNGNDNDASHIWSHKWNLSSANVAPDNHPYTTATPAANGGFIKIDDYLIEPTLSCPGVGGESHLNEIGVLTHETGHAFGLPDLYDTYDGDGKTQGDGNWDLMATGAWGCNGSTAQSPCHLGAWSKAMLGWVTVTTVPDGTDLGSVTLPPVETSHSVYRVNAEDGSGEYFLLENRQALGFDAYLPGTGMLVWQIDPAVVATRWIANQVNGWAHMGVRVRQADGRDDLGRVGGNRGDRGDPFPYVPSTTANRVFHAESNPSSRSWPGTVTGLTLVDISTAGEDVSLHLSTRFTQVTVASEGGEGGSGLFTVDGAPVATSTYTYASAPFVLHSLEAAAGESIGDGVRLPFQGWADDDSAPRLRAYPTPMEDVTVLARYGEPRQAELAVTQTGGVNGVTPATFSTEPPSSGLWFVPGTTVKIEAVPHTGFRFLQWTGALAGQPNPATLMLDGPTQAGADFELTYGVAARTVEMVAAEAQEIDLQADNANDPVTWSLASGQLPDGLVMDQAGRILGAALVTGTFPLVVQATDALGLTASASVSLVISEPVISLDALASKFLMVGPVMTNNQRIYLDRVGNDNGLYDLGDFRSWVLSHPSLPLTAPARALIASPRVIHVGQGSGAAARDGGNHGGTR
ncbi:MAG: M6 family metalloprotease domain-containing protein [Gemmatimonadetes bacterium]|nr:M6 family metalloprotease domain-containing protein [Gemmatimonadota bacterium]